MIENNIEYEDIFVGKQVVSFGVGGSNNIQIIDDEISSRIIVDRCLLYMTTIDVIEEDKKGRWMTIKFHEINN